MLRNFGIGAVGPEGELALRDHHALHVLEGFEACACWNVTADGAALLVEPFSALANGFWSIGIVCRLSARRRFLLLVRLDLGCLFLGGQRSSG